MSGFWNDPLKFGDSLIGFAVRTLLEMKLCRRVLISLGLQSWFYKRTLLAMKLCRHVSDFRCPMCVVWCMPAVKWPLWLTASFFVSPLSRPTPGGVTLHGYHHPWRGPCPLVLEAPSVETPHGCCPLLERSTWHLPPSAPHGRGPMALSSDFPCCMWFGTVPAYKVDMILSEVIT